MNVPYVFEIDKDEIDRNKLSVDFMQCLLLFVLKTKMEDQ